MTRASDLLALAPAHLGDPLAAIIAEAIGYADMDTVINAVMPAGERWELSTLIAGRIRAHAHHTEEGSRS